MINTEFVNHSNELGNLVCLQKTAIGTCTIRQLNNLRWLLINNTLQSICNLDHPESFLLPHLQQLANLWQQLDKPNKVLEVGLGGGVIRNYLQVKYPLCEVITIEKSPEIIELYQQFFTKETNPKIVNSDITSLDLTEKFEWLVLDLFSQQDCPIFLFHQDFYLKIKELFISNKERHLFINFICENTQQIKLLEEVLKEVFEVDATVYPIKDYNNKIVHLHF
ncbi:SAM-dependent methyltransferase [Pseudoalteromonas sp. SSM20]|uniref:SAM-dependent methyltransferase n=1 Tax=unclassified Pseudoalteromonas TaxID=194690 RepID=UPI00237E1498|nr:SAM-dependent methyltransferase [Pseudoalteromonas sp. G4]MDE3271572.1 SAM-dependent methyltransferase [Pseudoalteromonas sp. G4]